MRYKIYEKESNEMVETFRFSSFRSIKQANDYYTAFLLEKAIDGYISEEEIHLLENYSADEILEASGYILVKV